MSHHARAHSWRAAYSATLAIATTATNKQASKGHLLRPADAAAASLISPSRLQQHQRNWKVRVWKREECVARHEDQPQFMMRWLGLQTLC